MEPLKILQILVIVLLVFPFLLLAIGGLCMVLQWYYRLFNDLFEWFTSAASKANNSTKEIKNARKSSNSKV